MSECNICCETIKGRNKEIKCIHCNFSCCVSCIKYYILDNLNGARCMSPECGKEWNRDFLVQCFGYTWVNGPYKKHRENILFDLEKAKFEETMIEIENRRHIDGLKCKIEKLKEERNVYINKSMSQKSERDEYANNLTNLGRCPPRYQDFYNIEERIEWCKESLNNLLPLKDILDNQNSFDKEIYDYNKQIFELENDIRYNRFIEKTKSSTDRFFGYCPVTNCKGLINSSWKCAICQVTVCKSCKEKIADDNISEDELQKIKREHKCDENTLASLKTVKRESRPCPKCKVPIVKISGCLQMWCTECHVAFDWRTGNVVTSGIIHNPHYIEWSKNNEVDDNEEIDNCGLEFLQPYKISKISKNISVRERDDILQLVGFMVDIEYDKIERINYNINNDKWMDYRIDFMTNKISEEEFRLRLQRREKKIEKDRDFVMIFEMFVNTTKNYFNKYIAIEDGVRNGRYTKYKYITDENLKSFNDVVDRLIDYTNESFMKLNKKYKNKVYMVLKEEKIVRRNWTKGKSMVYELIKV